MKNYKYIVLKSFIFLFLSSHHVFAEERVWADEMFVKSLNESKSEVLNTNQIRKKKLPKSIGMDEKSTPIFSSNSMVIRKEKLVEQYAHINSEKSNIQYVDIKNKRDYDRYMKTHNKIGTVIKNEKNKKILHIVKIKDVNRLDKGLIGVNAINNKNVKITNRVSTHNVQMKEDKKKRCVSKKNIHSHNHNIEISNNVSHQNSNVSDSIFGVSSQSMCE